MTNTGWIRSVAVATLVVSSGHPMTAPVPVDPGKVGQPLAIEGVGLIDGTESPLRRNVTIVVINRRIAAIGPDGQVAIPGGARRVDGTGLFAIPGLWDMHVHLTHREELAFYLANGITSVRDMGSDIAVVRPWRDSIQAGTLLGPRIKTSGPVLESPQSIAAMVKDSEPASIRAWRVSVPEPEAAAAAVESIAGLGVDFIKARTYVSPAAYLAIAAAVRKTGLMFVGHPPFGLGVSPEAVAAAGQRTLEHGFFPDRVDTLSRETLTKVTDAYRRNRVALVPTLVAWEGHRMPFDTVAVMRPRDRCEPMAPAIETELTSRWASFLHYRRAEHPDRPESAGYTKGWGSVLDRHYRDLATLRAQGVPVLPGTDQAAFLCPETTLNRELELFVSGVGMTPLEAIRSATIQPAEAFGMADSLGTLEPGKLADLVLLGGNPLENITNLRRVRAVVAGGEYRERKALGGSPR